MRRELWPDQPIDELRHDVDAFFDGRATNLWTVLFAVDDAIDDIIGFAELNIRVYAEGCVSSRIAFLEGWYVAPQRRGCGVGAALIQGGEQWALSIGCTEFASDAQAGNALGRTAHLGVGFEEVEVLRCFRKVLVPATPRKPGR